MIQKRFNIAAQTFKNFLSFGYTTSGVGQNNRKYKCTSVESSQFQNIKIQGSNSRSCPRHCRTTEPILTVFGKNILGLRAFNFLQIKIQVPLKEEVLRQMDSIFFNWDPFRHEGNNENKVGCFKNRPQKTCTVNIITLASSYIIDSSLFKR